MTCKKPPVPGELKRVTIFTDGAAEPNPGPGGFGVVLRYGKHVREISGGYRHTTNNRMELLAAIAGLEALKMPCEVRLHSDSQYVVHAVEHKWVFRWRTRGWRKADKSPALNADLWQRFLAAYEQHRVTMVWVKGHAGIRDNERCDQLASHAVARHRKHEVDEPYEAMCHALRTAPPVNHAPA